jgi:hypothetical protein
MNKKRYFQSPHIWLLPVDSGAPVCTLQQGSRVKNEKCNNH